MEVLLRKEIIKDYDVNSCKDRVDELLTEYIRCKYLYGKVLEQGEEYYDSSTGANYDLVAEMKSINYKDRVGNKICFKIYNEQEAKRMKQDINELCEKFTDPEKDFFKYVLLNHEPQRVVEDKYKITRCGLEPIRKSCIVKSAMFFDVAVYR